MNRVPFGICLCSTILLGVLTPLASAQSLSVANHSFELPFFSDGSFRGLNISAAEQGGYGWSFTDSSGIYNPPTADYTNAGGSGTPLGADGSQVGYSNVIPSYVLSQVLAGSDGVLGNGNDDVLMASTLYTLTVSVGQRLPGNQFAGVYGGYDILLLAGTGMNATIIGRETDAFTPTPGTFVDRTFIVDSSTLNPSLYGQPLTIRMGITQSGTDFVTDFDNVRLSASPIPAPSSLAVLGVPCLVGTVMMLRRRRK